MRGWFPELVDPRQRSLTHGTIDVHRADIEEMLKTNTATTVHQRLRDEHGLGVGLTSFRRYVWREFPEDNLRNIATPPRPDVAAGRRGSDRLRLPRHVARPAERAHAPGVGLRHGAGLLVATCSCGRCSSWTSARWTACHVEAFAFFGGVPRRLVSDNLKTGVIKPDIYDPLLNRSYAELAAHYGCLIDPGSGPEAKGQAPGRAHDALRPRFHVAGP